MGESLDDWREFFRTTDTEIFEFIDTAITIAALDRPRYFLLQRDRIAERLFLKAMTQSRHPGCGDPPASHNGGDDCVRTGKESKRIRDNSRDNAECDVVDMNRESYRNYGGAETFSDEIDEQSQVGEVLRIKQVLDNSQHEFDSALYESLRKLQLMTISKDILEKTKIGITVNSLRRKGGSTQIAQLAHNIIMGWKAMIEEICRSTKDIAAKNSSVDPRKLGETDYTDRPTLSVKNQNITKWHQEKHSNEAGSIANRNQRPNLNKHQATVNPNTSSSISSRKVPPCETAATWKFEKERRPQNSNGIMGCKRLFTGRQDKINCSDEVSAEKKSGASKRILQEHDRLAETAKRQQIVLALPALPKQPTSHHCPGPRARIGKALSQMAKSRSRDLIVLKTKVPKSNAAVP